MEKSIDKIAKNRESDLKSSPIWARCSRSNDQNKAGYKLVKKIKSQKKVKCDRPTNRPTDRRTKQIVESPARD